MPFKVSFFYSQNVGKQAGWTESFWNTAIDLSTAVARATTLYAKLLAVHGLTTFITHVRFSEIGAFRRVAVTETGATDNPNVPASFASDYPTNALLLELRAVPNYVVRQWLKGIPDNQVSAGGFYFPTAEFKTRVNALTGVLLDSSQGWAMYVQDKNVLQKDVQGITTAGVLTVPAHGYATNDKVRLSRLQGFRAANKVWKVTAIDANTFSLNFWEAPPSGTVLGGNPIVQKQVKILQIPSGAGLVRATKHNVGRPFGLLSGRRRNRAS